MARVVEHGELVVVRGFGRGAALGAAVARRDVRGDEPRLAAAVERRRVDAVDQVEGDLPSWLFSHPKSLEKPSRPQDAEGDVLHADADADPLEVDERAVAWPGQG